MKSFLSRKHENTKKDNNKIRAVPISCFRD